MGSSSLELSMGVTIRTPYFPICTDSHADWFVRNKVACKGDYVASAHGCVAKAIRLDPSLAPDAEEPLSLEEAKQHIRYEGVQGSDGQILSWMRAAFRKIESDTGVASLTSQWRMSIDCFPAWRLPLAIPIWPIQSVDLISYYTADGVLTQISSGSPGTTLILDAASRPARLALERVEDDWPSDLREFQPGIIEVTAGFTDAALYPDELKQAAKILIGQSALFREHAVAGPGLTVTSVLMDYDRWIEGWRLPAV